MQGSPPIPAQATPLRRAPWYRLPERQLLLASVLAFAFCLWLPAFTTRPVDGAAPGGFYGSGLAIFMTGWMGPLAGLFEWYANPPLALGWLLLLLRRPRAASACGVAALALALTFALRQEPVSDNGRLVYVGTAAGYWMWTASMALLAAAGVLAYVRQREGAARR